MEGQLLLESVGSLLLLMCLLQVKHMFADFFLQTSIMLRGRGRYAHMGRLLHVLLHGALTAGILLMLGVAPALALALVLFEIVVHFHIDYFKSRFTAERNLTPAQATYWRALGADQALHQLTYVAIIGLVLWLDEAGAAPAASMLG